MALVELIMPAMGEAVMEATILKWLKQAGDAVAEDEPVVEIATDKVDSEILSNVSGVIKELFFKEKEVAAIGAKIALIETVEENAASENPPVKNTAEIIPDETANEQKPDVPHVSTEPSDDKNISSSGKNNGFYSPLVMSIAQKEGIGFDELAAIAGSGNEGRLTKRDLLAYLENRNVNKTAETVASDETATTQTDKNVTDEIEESVTDKTNEVAQTSEIATDKKETNIPKPVHVAVQTPVEYANATSNYSSFSGNVEIIEMDRIRKMIARHMKDSQNISATVTSFAEADVTNMVMWRNSIKRSFEEREQTRITFTPMFIECVARVIKRFPLINSSVENNKIILKKNINIGLAAVLPNGNLVVPVIKDVDCLNLIGLTKKVNAIANNARNNQLSPGDTQDGTFTVTNVGAYGSLTGTPIIHQPQVAILAIGTIIKRPVVIESPSGDTIGIRSMAILALSYDHRIIDGALGSTFLHDVVKEIEAWDVKREF